MAGYTVVNLKTVEDQAPKFGFAPHLQSRFARKPWAWSARASATSRSRPTSAALRPPPREEEEVYVVVAGARA